MRPLESQGNPQPALFGSALLLGPGLALAERINLNGGTVAALGALKYAKETIPANAHATTGRYALELAEAYQIAVKPRRAIGQTEAMYLRIDLSGAHFGSNPGLASGALRTSDTPPAIATGNLGEVDEVVSSGGAGMNFAVLKLGSATAGIDVPAANLLAVHIGNGVEASAGGDLQLTSRTGNVSATITAYTNPDDALDKVNAKSTFGGAGTFITLVSGLKVSVAAASPAPVASVDHGFLWFVKTGSPPVTGQARLGWLGVEETPPAEGATGVAAIRKATDGSNLANNDIIGENAKITFNVNGNLDIGAFTIKAETFSGTPETTANATGTCSGVAKGSVDQGTLVDSAGKKLINEDGDLPSGVTSASSGNLDEDTYLLCLNVDVKGPETNASPIPTGDYTATAYTRTTATADPVMVGEGKLASIGRNGASVEIPYLTTSEKHNQRLIVVNRGTRPAPITSIVFTTESGTEVELTDTVQAAMDAGLLVVPPKSSWVGRMDETIVITGTSRRIAASLAIAASAGNISVATTQVNVSDGSTDTVVYDVN